MPLGVFKRNENKLDQMCEIMDKLHEYVPAVDVKEFYDLFDDGCIIEVEEEMFHQILFGGDQLTVAIEPEKVLPYNLTMLLVYALGEIAWRVYSPLLKTGMPNNVYSR